MSTIKVGESDRGVGYVDTEEYRPHDSWANRTPFPHTGYVIASDGHQIPICQDRNQFAAELAVLAYLGLDDGLGDAS